MSTDIKTHDVAVATKMEAPTQAPKSPASADPDAKPNVETETAPKQVQPEGR